MSQETPPSNEFTPDECEIIAVFEEEGAFGPHSLKRYSEWIDKNEPKSEGGEAIPITEEVKLSLRKAKLLLRLGLITEAKLAAEDAYDMILHRAEHPKRHGELTPEEKDLGNEARGILEKLDGRD